MKPEVTTAQIAEFLGGRYARIDDLRRLEEGEDSLAYAATADGCAIVVRVNAACEGFEKDAFVAENWPALKAPKVIAIEPLSNAWICISEWVPGTTLQALGARAGAYGQDVVDLLDAMAAIDTSHIVGYGPFDAGGRGSFPTWQDFMTSVEGPQTLVRFVSDYNYGAHRALVHGDFGSNNVLADKAGITGVLDWSEAMVGDSLYDWANLFFWRPWLACMEVQCRFMENNAADRLRDPQKLARYQVRIGLQVAAEARLDGDAGLEKWALDRCKLIFAGASADADERF